MSYEKMNECHSLANENKRELNEGELEMVTGCFGLRSWLIGRKGLDNVTPYPPYPCPVPGEPPVRP